MAQHLGLSGNTKFKKASVYNTFIDTTFIVFSDLNHLTSHVIRVYTLVSVYGVCEGLAAGTINITMIITRYESGVTIGIRTEASRLYVDEIALDTTTQGLILIYLFCTITYGH